MQKYRPITEFLLKQNEVAITATFQEIEGILGFALPASAYSHRAWWANTLSHPQAKSWMEAGWNIRTVTMNERTVVYARPIHILVNKVVKKRRKSTLAISVSDKDITLVLSGGVNWFSATQTWQSIIQILLDNNPHMFGHLTGEPDHHVIPEMLAELGYSVVNQETGESWKARNIKRLT
jgi:hypothetical protein